MSEQQTVLHDVHVETGARMVPFAGWNMPVQYPAGVKAEHLVTRTNAGIFDVGHMGKVELSGKAVAEALERLTPWPMRRIKQGRAKYTVFLDENGGVVDDLIVYRRNDDQFFVIWNASNHQKNMQWTEPIWREFDVRCVDRTLDTALIALQGPKWKDYFERVRPSHPLPERRFTFVEHDGVAIVRTGYTGEDGVEIWLPNDQAVPLWRDLLEAGVQPCGLGARDSLRIEAGLPLYGHELSSDIGPVAGGVGFVIKKNAEHDFIGAAALDREPQQQVTGLYMVDRGVPREGYEILDDAEQPIGYVTSGSYSPVLETGIGLALVTQNQTRYDGNSRDGFVVIRGRRAAIKLVQPPIHQATA